MSEITLSILIENALKEAPKDGSNLIEKNNIGFNGKFEIHRADGSIEYFEKDNIVPQEGLIYILQRIFNQGTGIADWYMGIYTNNYQPVSGDTGANISATTNEFVNYEGTTRIKFNIPTISSNSVSNSGDTNIAKFVATASGNINGMFLISSPTKGGVDGKVLSAIKFPETKSLGLGDTLKVQLTLTLISQ